MGETIKGRFHGAYLDVLRNPHSPAARMERRTAAFGRSDSQLNMAAILQFPCPQETLNSRAPFLAWAVCAAGRRSHARGLHHPI